MVKTGSRIRFYLHIYRLILMQDLKSKMSYRADFFISILGMILTNVSNYIVFYIIFLNFPSIKGWSYYEMIFLYGFSLIALTPVQCFFENNWNLREYVYSGEFIKYCFRPINLYFYYISEIFDLKGLGQLFFGIVILIHSWRKLALPVTFFIIVKVIFSLFFSSLFMCALMNVAAALNFWIINSAVLMTLPYKFRDYAKYPVSIFNTAFRIIFTFIIPISFIAYYPSLGIIRTSEAGLLSYGYPFFGILYFYLSYKLWMKGARSYSGTGS